MYWYSLQLHLVLCYHCNADYSRKLCIRLTTMLLTIYGCQKIEIKANLKIAYFMQAWV